MDPTKADRGTTAIIEVDGLSEPLRNVRTFSVSDDYLQCGDTFSALVPDPRHDLIRKIEQFATYRFYLRNPAIDGGTPSLRQTGVLHTITADGSTGGDVLNLQGSDLGWHLQQSATPFYRLEQATMKDLLDKLIFENAGWGFKGVRASNDLNRRLRQGRLAETIRFTNSVITPYLVIQVNPGESIIGVVREYARRDGVMVNVSADGWLQLSNPSYDQPVSFQVNYHAAGGAEARTNNVLAPTELRRDGNFLYTEVVVCWDQLFLGVAQGPFQANPGRHAATWRRVGNTTEDVNVEIGAVTPTAVQAAPLSPGPKFSRRHVTSDSEPMTPEQGARRAVWLAERLEYDSWIYGCKLAGHSQNGKWLCSDTLASVDDSIRGVKGTYYCPRVRLDADRSGANTTYVELRKPWLLSNSKLVLGTVQHRGDGVFYEVTVDG